MSVYYSEYIPVSSGSGIEGRSLIDLTSTSFADLFSQAAAYSGGTTYTKGTLVYDQDAVWVYINASSSSGNAPPTLPTISNAYWELVSRNSPPSLSAYLTNESIQLFAYANGSVVDYGGATGSFKVFSGNTDVSSSFTIDDVVNEQGLTIDFVGQVYTVTTGFDAIEDTASVTIRATGSGLYAGIVLDKVLTLSKAKGGYEIVPTLPSTNLFEGRVVFLTADDRLYRYNGSTWTSANPSGSANMLSGVMPGINPNRFAYISYNPDSKPYANNGFGNMISSTGSPFAGTTTFIPSYDLPGYEVFGLWQTDGTAGGVGYSNVVLGRVTDLSGTININWSVEAGKTYEFSVYTGAERCKVEAFIIFVNSSGAEISQTTESTNDRELSGAGNSLSSFKRLVSRGVAPTGAVNAFCVLRKYHTTQSLGFIDSLMFAARPMLVEAQAGATDVTPWSPPSLALFYAENIVAGSITAAKLATTELITVSAQIKDLLVTNAKIENLTIGTQKIEDLSITRSSSIKLDFAGFSFGTDGTWFDLQVTVPAGYTYVGPGMGDYIYDGETDTYISVGAGNGDYAYTAGGLAKLQTAITSASSTAAASQVVDVDCIVTIERDGGSDDNVGLRVIRTNDSRVLGTYTTLRARSGKSTYALFFKDPDPLPGVVNTYKVQGYNYTDNSHYYECSLRAVLYRK